MRRPSPGSPSLRLKGGDIRYPAIDSDRPRCSELAERSASGTRVRLLWREGTKRLWVEVQERGDRVLAIPVESDQALEAFQHPYAFVPTARTWLSAS